MNVHLVRHPADPLRVTWCGEAATKRDTVAHRSALAQEQARLGGRVVGLTRFKDPIVSHGGFSCSWCRFGVEKEAQRLAAILDLTKTDAPSHAPVPL